MHPPDQQPTDPTEVPFGPLPPWAGPEARWLITRLEAGMALTQAQLDAYAGQVGTYAAQVTAATDGIRGDIEAIKAANPEVDTTALEARLAELGTAAGGLQGLDAENPPEPSAP
jgi:hypothetical protein